MHFMRDWQIQIVGWFYSIDSRILFYALVLESLSNFWIVSTLMCTMCDICGVLMVETYFRKLRNTDC